MTRCAFEAFTLVEEDVSLSRIELIGFDGMGWDDMRLFLGVQRMRRETRCVWLAREEGLSMGLSSGPGNLRFEIRR